MEQEQISVIVPAYNTAPWLERCLDSLLAQSYQNLEVVVVNDGSTDDTKAVLDAYAASHGRVRVIHQENGGVTSARLRGVAEARGAWIGFMDGDDVIEADMYAHLMENARVYQADISHCGHQVHFLDGRVEYVHNTGCLEQQDRLAGLRALLDGGMVDASLCTKLFRRELFEGLEGWMDPTVKNNEDLMMNYHLFSRAERSVFEDVCPYHYLLRKGSASYKGIHENQIFDPIRVRQRIVETCEEGLRADARNALMRNCLFAYGQLTMEPSREYDDFRRRVRALLTQQREYFPLLRRRNRILANMICIAPWSFRLAYGLYVKLFQREEQH